MSNLKPKFLTDEWITATWDEYVEAIKNPADEKAKGYYHNGQLRIEMSPIGSGHSRDHGIIILALTYLALPTLFR